MDDMELLKRKLIEQDPSVEQDLAVLDMVSKIVAIIINERNKQKLTQKELATKVGVKQSAIARFENLKVMPSIGTVAKILYGLGQKLEVMCF